jgi:hypothetical protein
VTTKDEVVKAAEAFVLARGIERRGAEFELRRAVKRLRAERGRGEREACGVNLGR